MKTILYSLICGFCFSSAQITVLPTIPDISFSFRDDDNRHVKDKFGDKALATEEYEFAIKNIEHLVANFEYSLGSLEIKSGSRQKITGKVTYDPEEFSPRVVYDTFGSEGVLKAKIKTVHGSHDEDEDRHSRWEEEEDGQNHIRFNLSDFNDDDFDQEYLFKLPKDIRTDLKLDFGLGDADIDLTDLDIASLEIECGLSDSKLACSEPNRIKCKEIYIESGLADFNAYGLGNLRSKYINIEVGLGSAYVDLSKQDVNLVGDIDVGLGSLELVLPEKANIKIRVEDSFLSSVDVDELVKTGHKEWSSPEWNKRSPSIELDISIGLGSVDVDLIK